MPKTPKLQVVTNDCIPLGTLLAKLRLAITCGVDCVQFRSRHYYHFHETARIVADLCAQTNTLCIINNQVHTARLLRQEGFDVGTWIGQNDMNAAVARNILGDDAFIGLSVNNVAEATIAEHLPVDAVAANGILACTTNPNAQQMGMEGLQRIISSTTHPVIAIGGLNHFNIPEMIDIGARGVAVSGAILRPDNTETATKKIVDACYHLDQILEEYCQNATGTSRGVEE